MAYLPDVKGNGQTPGGIQVAGSVVVGRDMTGAGPNTVGSWTISEDGSFYQYIYDNGNYAQQTWIVDAGDPDVEHTPYTGDIYRILGTVRGRIWGIDADGSMTSIAGIGRFGHAAPNAASVIAGALSAVTDAAAKAVLTSIIAALIADGGVTDGTT